MPIKRGPLRYAHSPGYTDVCYSSDGKHILTCGRDGDIRIWLGIEDDDPQSLCAGDYTQCVLLDNENNIYLANDALAVQILSFPEGQRMGIVTKFSAPVNHLAFDSERKIIAAGGEDMSVQVISVADKKVLGTFEDIEGPVLSVALSPKGKFLAVSSGDGSLKIWSVEEKSVLKEFNCVPCVNSFNSATVLCRTSFEPTRGLYFAYPDTNEVHVVETKSWSTVVTLREESAKGPFMLVSFSPCGDFLAAATVKGCICVWQFMSQKLIGYSPHLSKHDVCSLVWNPLGNGEIVYCDITGQIGAVEGCSDSNETVTATSESTSKEKDVNQTETVTFDESDEDDENVISLEKLKSSVFDGTNLEEDDKPESSRPPSRSSISAPPVSTTKLQPPFQPSSTPVHLIERYLVWNTVGIIRILSGDDISSSFIDVTFNDVNLHHLMHFRNTLGHSMASLSEKVIALASEAPSKLVCITLNNNKEWQFDMADGEEILCVSASDTHVSIATDARLLRIFSIHGTQRDVISIPGPVVTLVSKTDSIIVAYHAGIGVGSDQNIMLMIITIKGIHMKCTEMHLPLTPSSLLSWLGFTNLGSPVAYDSAGVLRLFSSQTLTWHPVFDYSLNRKGISDDLFIINVDEENQYINAIACKGSCYPPITPRPIISEFKFSTPLCDSDTEKSRLEDTLIRTLHTPVNNPRVILETAIKLFSLACVNDLETKAFEFVEMLTEVPKFAEIAWKYAAKRNRTNLADKITEFLEKLEENQTDDDLNNGFVADIHENRTEILSSFSQEPSSARNDRRTPPLRPLPVQQDLDNRVRVNKTTEKEEPVFGNDIQTTPGSIGERDGKKNPFSKTGKAPFKRNPNPFNVSGNAENNSEAKKRKEPDSVPEVSNVKKQSKLSCFAFKEN